MPGNDKYKGQTQPGVVADLVEAYNSSGREEAVGEESLFLLESGESLYVLAWTGMTRRP